MLDAFILKDSFLIKQVCFAAISKTAGVCWPDFLLVLTFCGGRVCRSVSNQLKLEECGEVIQAATQKLDLTVRCE